MKKLLWHVGMFGCSAAMVLLAVGWKTRFSYYPMGLVLTLAAIGVPTLWLGDPDKGR